MNISPPPRIINLPASLDAYATAKVNDKRMLENFIFVSRRIISITNLEAICA